MDRNTYAQCRQVKVQRLMHGEQIAKPFENGEKNEGSTLSNIVLTGIDGKQ